MAEVALTPRIVLLGASGFVGSAVLRQIAEQGGAAELLVHRTRPAHLPDGVRSHVGSVTQWPATLLPHAPHVVIHCASKQIDDDGTGFGVNEAGIAELAARITPATRAVLFVSSCSVYGDGPQRGVREDAPLRPETALARSRAACEQQLRALAERGRCRVEVSRPRFVLGRGDRHVLPGLARLLRRGWALGSGQQRFSVIEVDDFARVLLARARHALQSAAPRGFEAFNVGYARPVSLHEIETTLQQRLRQPAPQRRIPVMAPVVEALKRLPFTRPVAHRMSLLGLDHYGDVSRLLTQLDAPWLQLDPREALQRAALHLEMTP
jgi:nucleoside-diphosphate-sugar epimerase